MFILDNHQNSFSKLLETIICSERKREFHFFFMSQCIGLFEVIRSTHTYNVKISFGVIWSTIALLLKVITCVYNILFAENICKLMPNPAVLTSLNVISPMGFHLNVK